MAVLYETQLTEQRAVVEFRNGERLSGTIMWVKDWLFEFAFDRAIDAHALLGSLGEVSHEAERRANQRIQVDCSAKLRVNNRFYFGKIVDISSAGARFQTSGRLKRSGDGLLIVPDLPPMFVIIRWAQDGAFGLEMMERLPIDAVQGWLARRETAGGGKFVKQSS